MRALWDIAPCRLVFRPMFQRCLLHLTTLPFKSFIFVLEFAAALFLII
jgi:hypothetical protein